MEAPKKISKIEKTNKNNKEEFNKNIFLSKIGESENENFNGEKIKKLFERLNSHINSAENYENLKSYEEAINFFHKAKDVVIVIIKKLPDIEMNHLTEFYQNMNNHLSNKIMYLKTIFEISKDKELHKRKNSLSSENDPNFADLISQNKFNDSEINDKINEKLENLKEKQEIEKEKLLNEIDNYIEICRKNIEEIDLIKGKNQLNNNVNESVFYDKNSYYIPNLQSFNYNIESFNLNSKVINNYSIINNENSNFMNNIFSPMDFLMKLRDNFIEFQKQMNLLKNINIKEKKLETVKALKDNKLKEIKLKIIESKKKFDQLK